MKQYECTIIFTGKILAVDPESAKEEFAACLSEFTGLTEHITVKEV